MRGSLQVDPATGKASGEIVVDATSGKSDNDGRDKKMHKDVLESAKFGVPFIEWGLKNPSTWLLKVEHSVSVELELKGAMERK